MQSTSCPLCGNQDPAAVACAAISALAQLCATATDIDAQTLKSRLTVAYLDELVKSRQEGDNHGRP